MSVYTEHAAPAETGWKWSGERREEGGYCIYFHFMLPDSYGSGLSVLLIFVVGLYQTGERFVKDPTKSKISNILGEISVLDVISFSIIQLCDIYIEQLTFFCHH